MEGPILDGGDVSGMWESLPMLMMVVIGGGCDLILSAAASHLGMRPCSATRHAAELSQRDAVANTDNNNNEE